MLLVLNPLSISSGRAPEVEGTRLVRGFRVLILRQIVRLASTLLRCGFVGLAMFPCCFREPWFLLSRNFVFFFGLIRFAGVGFWSEQEYGGEIQGWEEQREGASRGSLRLS